MTEMRDIRASETVVDVVEAVAVVASVTGVVAAADVVADG